VRARRVDTVRQRVGTLTRSATIELFKRWNDGQKQPCAHVASKNHVSSGGATSFGPLEWVLAANYEKPMKTAVTQDFAPRLPD
jgi:hypothetical protein